MIKRLFQRSHVLAGLTKKKNAEMTPDEKEDFARSTIERALHMVRQEYTVMPRFAYHQPLDYYMDTPAAKFEPPVWVVGEELPLPPAPDRMGYPADDQDYLAWGKSDKELVMAQIQAHLKLDHGVKIMDFGCSSGRVLRHFDGEAQRMGWELYGVDIQARPIQWMREHFPTRFCVYTGSILPHLPFPDDHFDVIYGFSVFTHIKFHWDAWLLELRRVLKAGGLLIQTIHTENAWRFYYDHKDLDWVRNNHSARMLETRDMPDDYFYYGDVSVSQVFWKREVARTYWSRYLDVIGVLPPPDRRSFQDWMVCKKPDANPALDRD
jgi:SAM-dependent methyltransferase